MSRLCTFSFQAFVVCFLVSEIKSGLVEEEEIYAKCSKKCGLYPGTLPDTDQELDCGAECKTKYEELNQPENIVICKRDCMETSQRLCSRWVDPEKPDWKEACITFFIRKD